MIDDKRLTEIDEACKAATAKVGAGYRLRYGDARFYLAARKDIPDLVAEIRRLNAEVADLAFQLKFQKTICCEYADRLKGLLHETSLSTRDGNGM